jgi:hypothetical protein
MNVLVLRATLIHIVDVSRAGGAVIDAWRSGLEKVLCRWREALGEMGMSSPRLTFCWQAA